MSTLVNVPDLGVDQAEVIELLVKPGDLLKKDQPIAVLESDKASLELPATEDGVLVSWSVKIGDTVKVGDALLQFDAASGESKPEEKP
ncbi:MAG: biotin/lipoyl-containing protein, partial [Moraxellaceae bacterium]|nr:biotin/lipoyl-containing protein [Moraxellaceae bacterium]